MFDACDTPIIIDSDSCQREGQKLGLKGGTAGWRDEGAEISQRQNDFHALEMIQNLLAEKEVKS